MTPKERATMQLALDAFGSDSVDIRVKAVNALSEALVEPVIDPFGYVTVHRLSHLMGGLVDQYKFYLNGESPCLDNVDECHAVYKSTNVSNQHDVLLTEAGIIEAIKTSGLLMQPPQHTSATIWLSLLRGYARHIEYNIRHKVGMK